MVFVTLLLNMATIILSFAVIVWAFTTQRDALEWAWDALVAGIADVLDAIRSFSCYLGSTIIHWIRRN